MEQTERKKRIWTPGRIIGLTVLIFFLFAGMLVRMLFIALDTDDSEENNPWFMRSRTFTKSHRKSDRSNENFPNQNEDYLKINFNMLRDFDGRKKISEEAAKINGKKVAIRGFIVPVDSEGDKVSRFILLRAIIGCIFCQPPAMNQWIGVTTKDPKGLKFFGNAPVTVYGDFEAGEDKEDGEVIGLYQINADRISPDEG